MMDILMYLFETYIHSDSDNDFHLNQEELEQELLKAGFRQQDIFKALTWLEELTALQDTDAGQAMTMNAATSLRVYSEKEQQRLDTRCRGFILFLEQVGVLNTELREMVIDRVMGLETRDLHLDDLKWITLMVLFNVPGSENAYNTMEELLYCTDYGVTH
jgi:Smg protein